jgi:hypothetical protein
MPPHGTTLGAPRERVPGARASGGLVSIGAYQGKPPASAMGSLTTEFLHHLATCRAGDQPVVRVAR